MLTHSTRDVLTAQRVDFCLFDEGSRGLGAGAVWLGRKEKLPYLVGGGRMGLQLGLPDILTSLAEKKSSVFTIGSEVCQRGLGQGARVTVGVVVPDLAGSKVT